MIRLKQNHLKNPKKNQSSSDDSLEAELDEALSKLNLESATNAHQSKNNHVTQPNTVTQVATSFAAQVTESRQNPSQHPSAANIKLSR